MKLRSRSRRIWFVVGGVVSVLWGLLHVVMFGPLAFDPTLVNDGLDLSEGVTETDATHIADLLTLFNNALIVYMVGIGLLTAFGARTFATSRLGTGLLVMHVVFWTVRMLVDVVQAGWAEVGPGALVMVATLAVYVVPLFLRRQTEPSGEPA
jgi:hypothetical protein